MPPVPGLGYPLVPGYESVGRVTHAGPRGSPQKSASAFSFLVRDASARCADSLAARRRRWSCRARGSRRIEERLGEQARAARAGRNRLSRARGGRWRAEPDLIVGHGVLGRLLARLAVLARSEPPTVWERNPQRIAWRERLRRCIHPDADPRRDYARDLRRERRCDASRHFDSALAPGGEIVLAGFYSEPLSFAISRLRSCARRAFAVAAEWRAAGSGRGHRAGRIRPLEPRWIDHASAATRATRRPRIAPRSPMPRA